jgi:hypothetical protein
LGVVVLYNVSLKATTNFGRGHGGIEVGERLSAKASGIIGEERVAVSVGATSHFLEIYYAKC